MLRNLLRLRTVATIKPGLDDTKHLVGLFRARLRVNGGDVWDVVPVLVACGGKEFLLQRDNLIGASGGIGKDDELSVLREEVGEC